MLCRSWPQVPRTAIDVVAERGMGEGTRFWHLGAALGPSALPAVWGARDVCAPRPPPPRLTGPRSKGADGVTQVVPRPLQERPAMPDSLWRSASTLGEATYPLLSVRKAGTVTERGGAAELWGPLGRRSVATEGTRGVRSACCHVGTVCQLQRTM